LMLIFSVFVVDIVFIMDRELLGLSLSYHGSYLLDQLRAEEQLTLEDVIALKSTVPIPVSDEPRFVNNDCFFI